MSGGSWDYLYYKVEEAADRLQLDSRPLRKVFGAHLSRVAEALHDIEWADSGDTAAGSECPRIEAVLGDAVRALVIQATCQEARLVISQLEALMDDLEHK